MGESAELFKNKFLWDVIRRFDHYIATTNIKSSVILTFDGLVIGSILLKFNVITGLFAASELGLLLAAILLCCLGVTSSLSLLCAFRVISPFLKSGNIAGDYHSLLFFGSVADLTKETYDKKIDELDERKALVDLKNQSSVLAKGLVLKMRDLRFGVGFVFLSVTVIIALFLLKGALILGLL